MVKWHTEDDTAIAGKDYVQSSVCCCTIVKKTIQNNNYILKVNLMKVIGHKLLLFNIGE